MPKVINDSPTWFPNGIRTTTLTTTEIITSNIVTGNNVISAPQNAIGDFDVRAYGAVGDGSTTDTVAIQAAINAAGANSTVLFPDTGSSYVTGPLLVNAASGVRLRGTGRRGTQLIFHPTGQQSDTITSAADPGTCIQFANNAGASQQSQCALQDMSISCPSNSAYFAYDKNMVRLVNNSQFFMDNVSLSTFWGGPHMSCGLRVMGHEHMVVRNFYSNGSIPIRISADPGPGTISVDHFQFTNCYLSGPISDTSSYTSGVSGGKSVDYDSCCVLIDDGVRVAQMNWDGYQGWVRGREGIHWVAPTSPGDTQFSVVFKNIRKEQGYGTNNKIFNIQCNSTYPLQNIIFENCATGEDSTLFYLRNVNNVLVNGGGIIASLAAMSAGNYIVDANAAGTLKTMTWNNVTFPSNATNNLDVGFSFGSYASPRTGWTLFPTGTGAV